MNKHKELQTKVGAVELLVKGVYIGSVFDVVEIKENSDGRHFLIGANGILAILRGSFNGSELNLEV